MSVMHEVGGYRRPSAPPGAVRLDLNEAPREAATAFRARVLELLGEAEWRRYGDLDGRSAREAAARLYGWSVDGTLVGNGSNDLLAASLRSLVPRGGTLVALMPSFSMVPVLAQRAGLRVLGVPLDPPEFAVDPGRLVESARRGDAVLLCSPNNPTGGEVPADLFVSVLGLGKPVIWDAAYVEFSEADPRGLLDRHANLTVLRTLSKAWGLAGLRVGACLGDPRLISRVSGETLPYSTGIAVAAAFRAAAELSGIEDELVAQVVQERERMRFRIAGNDGFEVVPSRANFFLVRRVGWSGGRLHAALASRNIAVRSIPELAAAGYVRITVGSREEGDAVVRAIEEVCND